MSTVSCSVLPVLRGVWFQSDGGGVWSSVKWGEGGEGGGAALDGPKGRGVWDSG